jgi:nitrate reductase gamma subunit
MPHPESTTGLLHVAETVHWAALATMGVVYTLRLIWIFRFKAGKDRSAPGGGGRVTARSAAVHSLMNVAMPWEMESTRKNMPFWISFVLFHLGVAAGIALAFVSSIAPALVTLPAVGYVVIALTGTAFAVGLLRIVRRVAFAYMRLISTPDDYFSLAMLTVWFVLASLAQASLLGMLSGDHWLVAFLFATSFFLVYVPFSKISHYLYYPITRWYIGKALGHRGSYPIVRA